MVHFGSSFIEKIEKALRGFVLSVEKKPLTITLLLSASFVVISLHLMMEQFLQGVGDINHVSYWLRFVHAWSSLMLPYMAFVIFMHYALRRDIQKVATVLFLGFPLVWLPTILDTIIYGYYSSGFYEFVSLSSAWHSFVTFFSAASDVSTTTGTRIKIALAILGMTAYAWIITRSVRRTVYSFCGTYILSFIFATLPSWFAIISMGTEDGFLNISETDIAVFFFTTGNILWRTYDSAIIISYHRMNILYIVCMAFAALWIARQYSKEYILRHMHHLVTVRAITLLLAFYSGIGATILLTHSYALFLPQNTAILLVSFMALNILIVLIAGLWVAYEHNRLKDSFLYSFCMIVMVALIDHTLYPLMITIIAAIAVLHIRPFQYAQSYILRSFFFIVVILLTMVLGGFIVSERTDTIPHSMLWMSTIIIIGVMIIRFVDLPADRRMSSVIRTSLIVGVLFIIYTASIIIFNMVQLAPIALASAIISALLVVCAHRYARIIISVLGLLYGALLMIVMLYAL